MDDLRCEQFFRQPRQTQQRRYEILRACFLEHRPLPEIARQFGLAHGTVRNLVARFRHQCRADQLPPFSLPPRGADPPAPALPAHGQRLQPSLIAAESRSPKSARCVAVSRVPFCSCRCWPNSASTASCVTLATLARR